MELMLNFYGEYVRVNRHITTKLNQTNKKTAVNFDKDSTERKN